MSLRCVNPLRKAGEKTQEEDGTEQNKEVAGMNPAQPGEHKNKQKSTANTEVISQKSCRPDWDFYVKLEWKLRLFLCLAMAPVQSLPLPETWKKPLPPPTSCHPQRHFQRAPTHPCYQWRSHVHWQCSGTLTRPSEKLKITKRLKTTSLRYLPLLPL